MRRILLELKDACRETGFPRREDLKRHNVALQHLGIEPVTARISTQRDSKLESLQQSWPVLCFGAKRAHGELMKMDEVVQMAVQQMESR